MAEVKWGYIKVVDVTSTSGELIPAKGGTLGGVTRSSSNYLIQPITGAIRIGYDTDASATESALIAKDRSDTRGCNNAVNAIRDTAETSDVKVLVCFEGS